MRGTAATSPSLIPGSRAAAGASHLLPLVYDRLRALAKSYLAAAPGHPTLQPTALVHEAYVRLAQREGIDWQGKTHFLAIAAVEMRRVLVDHARAAGAKKRGGGARPLTLGAVPAHGVGTSLEVLALEEALQRLAGRSRRQARVAEMRIYAGMVSREIAEILGVSERTVKGDWRMARAWIVRELRGSQP